MLSVNSTPEDFSLKSRSTVSEIPETNADIKPAPESHNPGVPANFNLDSNKEGADLQSDIYAKKKSESPRPLYQNNPDSYLGSAPNSNTHSPTNVPISLTHSNHLALPNTSSSSQEAATAFSSYLSSTDNQPLPGGELPTTTKAIARPGSGPPGNFSPDVHSVASGYRPGSANPHLNRSQDMRSSPAATLMNSYGANTKISSPLSPSSQNASPAERPPFVNPSHDYPPASTFKPLPISHPNQVQGQQNYPNQTRTPPHLYNQGSSPSVSASGVGYEYDNNNYSRRPNTSTANDNHKPPLHNAAASNKSTNDDGESAKRVIVPADPMVWNREHVREWVEWTITEYNLNNVNTSAFIKLDGPALCAMTKDDFDKISSPRNAEILISHLNYLRNGPVGLPNLSTDEIDHVIQEGEVGGKHPSTVSSRGSYSQPQYHENSASGNRGIAPSSGNQPNVDPYQLFGAYSARLCNPGSGQIQLWQFLLELLSDPANSVCITWEGTNGEFKMVDPDDVARRWGERKSKPNMNYDKLSRALRYYYDKNIMTKVHGKRYAYKFDFQGLAATMQPQPDQSPYSFHPEYKHALYRGDVFNRVVPHAYPTIVPPTAPGYSPPQPKISSSSGMSPSFPPQTGSGSSHYSWHQREMPNYTSVSTLHTTPSNQSLPPTSFYN